MTTKRIIPCLDFKDGRVVKGVHFELARRRRSGGERPTLRGRGSRRAGLSRHLGHRRGPLTEGKADAALAASLFHDRVLSVREVKAYLAERGIAVRMNA
jgi:imidazole glycerol phosphate synthase subunit HisF